MNHAKIKELLEEKFHSILCQSECSLDLSGPASPIWTIGRSTPSVISSFSVPKKERKEIMSKWGSYIRQLGMTRVYPPKNNAAENAYVLDPATGWWTYAPKNAAENAYVLDPATNWFNAGVPSRLWRRRLYVKVPRELATKILVLGALP